MNDYRLDWQDGAIANLRDIRAYLEAEASVTVANQVLGDIFEQTEILSKFPLLAPIYQHRPAFRRLVIGSYAVYYRVLEDVKLLRVYGVFHHAMDVRKHLK